MVKCFFLVFPTIVWKDNYLSEYRFWIIWCDILATRGSYSQPQPPPDLVKDQTFSGFFSQPPSLTCGNTGFNQQRRTPCERAARQGMAHEKKAKALEGASLSDIFNPCEEGAPFSFPPNLCRVDTQLITHITVHKVFLSFLPNLCRLITSCATTMESFSISVTLKILDWPLSEGGVWRVHTPQFQN